MTGGRASRQKGDRAERALVKLFQEAGIHAERVPLSGSAGGSYRGDLTVAVQGQDRRFEAKVRAGGFVTLYTWLSDHYGLFVKSDRHEPLIVLRASDFIELAKGTPPSRASAFFKANEARMFAGMHGPAAIRGEE